MNDKLTKEEAQELLRKYRMGECTQREIEIVNHWYYTFEQGERGTIQDTDADLLNDLKMEMLEKITHEIDTAEVPEIGGREVKPAAGKRRFLTLQNISRMAAVLLVGVCTGGILYNVTTGGLLGEKETLSLSQDRNMVKPNVESTSTSKVLYLADGTVVWLKEGSELNYPSSFSGSTRQVHLIGEAFFDVAADKEKPFIIHASNFTTRVVGTSFNIKAYGHEDSQEVVVVTGKVVVSLNESSPLKVKELVLRPNEKAIYSRKDNSLVEAEVKDTRITGALKKNKLDFDEASLENIVKVLNASYDVNIKFEDGVLRNCVITADLTNESPEVSVAILAKAINGTYSINGKDIILHGTGCGVQP